MRPTPGWPRVVPGEPIVGLGHRDRPSPAFRSTCVEQGNDHDADPLQYRLPNMDFTLDMRFCSRKREINRESSFSVVG